MALRTARTDKHVRCAIFSTEGQQTPSSLALSAKEIKTAFCSNSHTLQWPAVIHDNSAHSVPSLLTSRQTS